MMVGTRKAFEDFTIGDSIVFHRVTVSKEDIIDFAAAWDPKHRLGTPGGGEVEDVFLRHRDPVEHEAVADREIHEGLARSNHHPVHPRQAAKRKRMTTP